MTLKFLLRLVDNLFRHPIRYLIPVVLLGIVGVLTLDEEEEFSSTGVVFVETNSFLSSVTNINSNNRTFQSAADAAGSQLVGLIGTDTFTSDVLRRIQGEPEGTQYSAAQLIAFRQSVGVGTRPGSLLTVTGRSLDPLTAQAAATGVIDAYIDWQIEADLAQSQSAEAYLSDLATERENELEAAQDALRSFLLLNPDPAEGARPTAEALTLSQLEADASTARDRYEAALQDVEVARLATSQTEVDTRVNLRVVDQPSLPLEPASTLMPSIFRVMLLAMLGVGASLGVLVLTTFTDTSIRFPAEIRDRLGKEPLAVVPRAQ